MLIAPSSFSALAMKARASATVGLAAAALCAGEDGTNRSRPASAGRTGRRVRILIFMAMEL
jgi:hypothetical protein